jgi:RNAse (barnase) inhibitor barstar
MMPLHDQIERILTAQSARLELPNDNPVADIVSALESEGCRVVILDRAPIFDKETLLHAIYQGCGFPAYFGFNWDALTDALVEHVEEAPGGWSSCQPSHPGAWRPSPALEASARRSRLPLILIFQDFDLLRDRNPDVAQTFIDIIDEVSELTEGSMIRLVCLNG